MDRIIRWAAAGSVLGLAVIAGALSYSHMRAPTGTEVGHEFGRSGRWGRLRLAETGDGQLLHLRTASNE